MALSINSLNPQVIENEKNKRNIASNTACHSEYPLAWEKTQTFKSELGDEEKCKIYWNAAHDLVGKTLDSNLLMSTHRIMVDGKYCYRPDLFKNKGWCKLADPNTIQYKLFGRTWGFCSSSCKVEFMKVNDLSTVYST